MKHYFNHPELLEARLLFAVTSGDFDNDGNDDLVIGVPYEYVADDEQTANAIKMSGVVHVIYGSPDGTSSEGNQLWSLRSPGIKGNPADFNRLGNALAAGDFNNDGFDDLAIGIDGRSVKGQSSAGAVLVLMGSEDGLTANGDRLLTQASTGMPGTAETNDFFGMALAAGDFDGDEFADLVISAPAEEVNGVIQAGRVYVLYGANNGVTTQRVQFWYEDLEGIPGKAVPQDYFGTALVTGDFDGNGRDDLAIGNPYDKVGSVGRAGSVTVLYGRRTTGLRAKGSDRFSQSSPGVAGTAELADHFGKTLAAGDFNGDDHDDLAIGAPNEKYAEPAEYSGLVHLLMGSDDKLVADNATIKPSDLDLPANERIVQLGQGLTAGNFDDDDFDDLALGANLSTVNDLQYAGRVDIAYGSASGPVAAEAQRWVQSLLSGQASEFGDEWAMFLGQGDLNGDDADDLIVAVPFEAREGEDSLGSVGGVDVIYSAGDSGLSETGAQHWSQDSDGILEEDEQNDLIGFTVDAQSALE